MAYHYSSSHHSEENQQIHHKSEPSKKDILRDIGRVLSQSNQYVDLSDYLELGNFSEEVIREKFTTWANAKREAEDLLKTRTPEKETDEEEEAGQETSTPTESRQRPPDRETSETDEVEQEPPTATKSRPNQKSPSETDSVTPSEREYPSRQGPIDKTETWTRYPPAEERYFVKFAWVEAYEEDPKLLVIMQEGGKYVARILSNKLKRYTGRKIVRENTLDAALERTRSWVERHSD